MFSNRARDMKAPTLSASVADVLRRIKQILEEVAAPLQPAPVPVPIPIPVRERERVVRRRTNY